MTETTHTMPDSHWAPPLHEWYISADEFAGPITTQVYKRPSGGELKMTVFEPPAAAVEGHGAPGGSVEATGGPSRDGDATTTDRVAGGPTEGRPGIVYFFGGGWVGGTPAQFFPHARYLSQRCGIVVFCPEYRTESSHGTPPFAALEDAKSAMRWIRGNAANFGVDPARVAAGGGSAGGHLAAACAFVSGWDSPGDDQSLSPKPDALVLYNPVLNNGEGNYGYERLGADAERFSPAHNVGTWAPPTAVFTAEDDHLITPEVLREFVAAVAATGADSEVHIFQDQGHGFFNYRGEEPDPAKRTQNWEFCYITVLRLSVEFLRRHGFVGPGVG